MGWSPKVPIGRYKFTPAALDTTGLNSGQWTSVLDTSSILDDEFYLTRLLVDASALGAAPTLSTPTQEATGNVASGAMTLTMPSKITAGHGLVLQGFGYVLLTSATISGGDTWLGAGYSAYVQASKGGYQSITITTGSSLPFGAYWYEVPAPISFNAETLINTTGTSWASSALACPDNSFIVAGIMATGSSAPILTPSASGGWTLDSVMDGVGSTPNFLSLSTSYQFTSPTATATPSYSGTVSPSSPMLGEINAFQMLNQLPRTQIIVDIGQRSHIVNFTTEGAYTYTYDPPQPIVIKRGLPLYLLWALPALTAAQVLPKVSVYAWFGKGAP